MNDNNDLLPEYIRMQAMEWRIRIENDVVDNKDWESFEKWRMADPRHADAYDRATTVWSAYGEISKDEVDPSLFPNSDLTASQSRHCSILKRVRSLTFPTKLAGGFIGATMVFLLLFIIYADHNEIQQSNNKLVLQYSTDIGEFNTVKLNDGSAMTLGPGTQVDVVFTDVERRVNLLKGAGVFNVAGDPVRPFFVDAEDFTAKVIGTVFDVRNNGGVVRMSVAEGIVEASHPLIVSREKVDIIGRRKLFAGQAIMSSSLKGLSDVYAFEANGFAAWRNNRLKYEDAVLAEIIADANRYSDRPIIIDDSLYNAGDMRVTFSFDGKNTDSMLNAVSTLYKVDIDTSDPSKIVIRARN